MTKDVSVSEADLLKRAEECLTLGEATGSRGQHPSNVYNVLADLVAALRSNLKEQPVASDVRRQYYQTIARLITLARQTELSDQDKIVLAGIAEEHSLDGLSCSCGGGWLMGHAAGCPEASPSSPVSRESVIEECARVAEAHRNRFGGSSLAGEQIAEAIRSLSPTDKSKPNFAELKRRAEIALDDLTAYAHNNEALEGACGESAKAMDAATWNRVKAEQALVAVRDMTVKSALSPEVGNDK